jgi:hypothetical protein
MLMDLVMAGPGAAGVYRSAEVVSAAKGDKPRGPGQLGCANELGQVRWPGRYLRPSTTMGGRGSPDCLLTVGSNRLDLTDEVEHLNRGLMLILHIN